ncbi:MAG TPA: 3-deoxy-manno-octulosonate cytidylyltransferase [Candidatus Cloacimonetes bacterium]|nr:3-deoxy-manno-octulosonate cytidylyltransferase [Candidatus Cloacimonadota bacterium]
MKRYAIIPARYGSTRFPGKALATLFGKPMILHVYEKVKQSALFDEVYIATDDMRISRTVEASGAKTVLTDPSLPSGTDRCAVTAKELDLKGLIINVQGDEPLIESAALEALCEAFEDPEVRMASLMTPLLNKPDYHNPNVVKVVVDSFSNAMYFSRSLIPFNRDNDPRMHYFRHVGVYGFRHDLLQEFVALPPGHYEMTEKLEQLRALENGIKIRMVETSYQGIGVDTPQDLEAITLKMGR